MIIYLCGPSLMLIWLMSDWKKSPIASVIVRFLFGCPLISWEEKSRLTNALS